MLAAHPLRHDELQGGFPRWARKTAQELEERFQLGVDQVGEHHDQRLKQRDVRDSRRGFSVHFCCCCFCWSPNLHDAEGLRLLHLAEDGSEDLVQLLAELRARPGDQRGHQAAHEGSGELGGARVQQLVDHLHDVPEAAVALLVPPLGDLLQGHGHVRPQALASVLGRRKAGCRAGVSSCVSIATRN